MSTMSNDAWRELAEKATKEQDPEKLMALVKERNGVLLQHITPAQRRRSKA
jgi:hypothetical protein